MINLYNISPRSLMLMDATGAFVSMVISGLVLPQFSSLLGIDPWILWKLAGAAFAFLIYDLVIYFAFNVVRPWMVKTMMALNLSYCLLSALLVLFLPGLSPYGIAALLIEIAVVIAVVAFEYRIFRQME
ncbi:MAG: hypothetical protein K2Q26_04540 [Bdellovibrionales bacterium]|nr:hypothetical protein [Bdellovibrionales bacterium]